MDVLLYIFISIVFAAVVGIIVAFAFVEDKRKKIQDDIEREKENKLDIIDSISEKGRFVIFKRGKISRKLKIVNEKFYNHKGEQVEFLSDILVKFDRTKKTGIIVYDLVLYETRFLEKNPFHIFFDEEEHKPDW